MFLLRSQQYSENGEKFPSPISILNFFHPRSKDIVVWSYGIQKGEIEAYFAENLGCVVNIFDSREGKGEYVKGIQKRLQTRTSEEGDTEELKAITKKWIKENQFVFSDTLPFSYTGTLDISGDKVKCISMKENEISKLDILKLDYEEFNDSILYSILTKGYRPGLIYIRWYNHPDTNVPAMIAAGNLQTCGYRLIGSISNWFLYIFMDDCMYEITSWNRTDCNNPMFEEYKKSILHRITD